MSLARRSNPSVESVIPHRTPFLFLDEVISLSESDATGIFCFDKQSPFLSGHFPNNPIVPGVLLVESLAQLVAYWALSRHPNRSVRLVELNRTRFIEPVFPGEPLSLHIQIIKAKLGLVIADGWIERNQVRVAEARIKGFFPDDKRSNQKDYDQSGGVDKHD